MLEPTGGSVAVARILTPYVRRVVVANAADVRAISHARVKSDRLDAAMLARLLAADLIPGVWVPDEATEALRRRVARRAALVRQLVRAKNEVHAVVMRCLLGRPPVSELFGRKGRAWLAEQELPEAETETVAGVLRQLDFLARAYSRRRCDAFAIIGGGGVAVAFLGFGGATLRSHRRGETVTVVERNPQELHLSNDESVTSVPCCTYTRRGRPYRRGAPCHTVRERRAPFSRLAPAPRSRRDCDCAAPSHLSAAARASGA